MVQQIRMVFPTLLFLFAVCLPGSADAQVVVKRAKCASAAEGYGTGVYQNRTGFTQYVMVQIVRESCRPRGQAANFLLRETNYDGTVNYGNSYVLPRADRNTWAVQRGIENNRAARVHFQTIPSGQRVSGTFDYFVQAD